ncbi:MAG: exodeoxyribonuclease VII large subunit [Terriglobales bacterium]
MEQPRLNFGPERTVWSVSALIANLKQVLEREFFDIWIEGEASNCKISALRHCYFTLKDGKAQLRAVLFASQAARARFQVRDGLQVRLRGQVSVYEPRGEVQCIVEHIEPLGRGSLQLAFEQLRDQLAAEGLFDAARKRSLPRLPRRIGLITSPRGAAVADMIRVLHRRFPAVHVLLYPVAVQGAAAAPEICQALTFFAAQAPGSGFAVDVLLVGRGGGSLEDLWAFNEETVARALARSPTPTISAVGHETDFTIADFIADARAPTPSAAAELAVRPRTEWLRELQALAQRLEHALRYGLLRRRRNLETRARHRAFDALRQRLHQHGQRTDDLAHGLQQMQWRRLAAARKRWVAATVRLRQRDPRTQLAAARLRLAARQRALADAAAGQTGRRRQHLDRLAAVLTERDPLRILGRGYALVYDAQGRLLARRAAATPGEALRIRFADGWLEAETRNARDSMEQQ